MSQTHNLTGSRLRHGDVRDVAIELTLHSILAAYAPYPGAEILWCIRVFLKRVEKVLTFTKSALPLQPLNNVSEGVVK